MPGIYWIFNEWWGIQLLVKNPNVWFFGCEHRQLQRLYLAGLLEEAALPTSDCPTDGLRSWKGVAVKDSGPSGRLFSSPTGIAFLALVLSLLGVFIWGLGQMSFAGPLLRPPNGGRRRKPWRYFSHHFSTASPSSFSSSDSRIHKTARALRSGSLNSEVIPRSVLMHPTHTGVLFHGGK